RLAFALARQGKLSEAELVFPRGYNSVYLALLPWFAGKRDEQAIRPLQLLLEELKANPKNDPFSTLHVIGTVPAPGLDRALALELADQNAQEAGGGNTYAGYLVFLCRYRAGQWQKALDNLPSHFNDTLNNRESLA